MLITGGGNRAVPLAGPDFQAFRRKPSAIVGLTPNWGVSSCLNQARSGASNATFICTVGCSRFLAGGVERQSGCG